MAESVTELLAAWGRGDESAKDRLLPAVYDDLKRIARSHLQGQPSGQTLVATALVHETYLKLSNSNWTAQDRVHFLSLASRMIRQILVDHARSRKAQKREGGALRVTFAEGVSVAAVSADYDLEELDRALIRLAEFDAQQARVVELRFFAGLTIEETAVALEISTATVKRDWAVARAWLRREIASLSS
jgi:RNA polymerase sigma-70 factor (ECF subfamily)